jgi:hypothetical protein
MLKINICIKKSCLYFLILLRAQASAKKKGGFFGLNFKKDKEAKPTKKHK